jgi:hypothetical protein
MKTLRVSKSRNRIVFIAYDPLENVPICHASLPYDAVRCAAGFYRKYYLSMIEWLPKVHPSLGVRKPRIEVGLQP